MLGIQGCTQLQDSETVPLLHNTETTAATGRSNLTVLPTQVGNGISTESAALERDVENLQMQITALQSKLNVTLERFDVVQQDCLSVETEIVDEVRGEGHCAVESVRVASPSLPNSLWFMGSLTIPDPKCEAEQDRTSAAATIRHVHLCCAGAGSSGVSQGAAHPHHRPGAGR